MIEASVTDTTSATTLQTESRRNPYVVTLLAVGGVALVIAFMLVNVVVQMTDYSTYEIEPVVSVMVWMAFWALIGVMSLVGAVVIAGVSWTLRREHR